MADNDYGGSKRKLMALRAPRNQGGGGGISAAKAKVLGNKLSSSGVSLPAFSKKKPTVRCSKRGK